MSRIRFDGRVAVVTGAGNGLGRAYALELAQRGAAVVVNDIAEETQPGGGSARAADLVVKEIRDAGGKALATYESVGTRTGADASITAALDAFGRIDAVINNAGNQANERFERMRDEDFESVLAVHLKGAFYLTQTAYKRMMAQQYGRILFTSSASGIFGHFIRTNYSSAKAGLIGLMHSVALEGERHGIVANALLPVAAGSKKLGKIPEDTLWPDWERRMPERCPDLVHLGAAMTPAHVAPLAVYLVSEACKSSHGIYSAVAGRFARVFIGATQGWLAAPERPASAEEVEEHMVQIEARADFEEYPMLTDELVAVARRLQQRKR